MFQKRTEKRRNLNLVITIGLLVAALILSGCDVVTGDVNGATTAVPDTSETIAAAEVVSTEAVTPTTIAATATIEAATAGGTNEAAARISELLGDTVETRQGEPFAEIEDVMIGLDSERVHYAILSSGGFLELGDELFPVPFKGLSFEVGANTATLNVDPQTLENAPGFDPDHWPDTAIAEWDIDIRDYWRNTETTAISDVQQAALIIESEAAEDEATVRASKLLAYDVVNPQRESLGEIEDLMVGLESGQVHYAVLAFGGFLDLGDKLFAIPVNALQLDPEHGSIIFSVDQEILEHAPGFDRDDWPDTANPRWDADISDFWQNQDVQPAVPPTTAGFTTAATDENAVRASTLLDYILQDGQGDSLGSIEGLLIGLNSGQLNYVVLSFDRAEAGQVLYPVPMSALVIDPEHNAFIFDVVTEDIFAEAPSFEPNNWPDTTYAPWDEALRDYWLARNIDAEPAVRAADLIDDYQVQTRQREKLGEIRDMMIGLTSIQVRYAVVSVVEEFVDVSDRLFPIPLNLLAIDTDEQLAVFIADQETLANAPSFDLNRWPLTSTPQWDVIYRDYWGRFSTPVTAEMTREALVESAVRATRLLGYTVENSQDEELGTIEDLMLGLDSGRVNYAVLGFGEFFDADDKLFAVPLRVLTLDPVEGVIIFDVEPETLENAPGFDRDDWPDTANPRWATTVRDYWAPTQIAEELEEIDEEGEAVSEAAQPVLDEVTIRATELLDYRVENFEGEALGEIEDLMIGLDSERVRYAVLSFGGILDIGDKLFAIPLETITPDLQQDAAIFDVEPTTLENAPGFNPNDWPETANPRWDEAARNYWEDQR